jgi:RND family efflux transporter MFP subunit
MKLPSFSITKLKTIKKRYIVLGVLGLFILFSIIRGALKEDTSKEFFTVETGTVTETIVLAGDVDMEDRVDLGFGSGGRVSSVLVEEGDVVQKGDVLARLSMNQLSAELLEAEANLRQAQADSAASGVDLDYSYQNLENITAQQDVLVENAYRALLSESLEAYTEDFTSATAPTISGTYMGNEEGDYLLSVYSSNAPSGYSFTISGLESGYGTVKTNAPSPLGSQGIYIQFAEGESYGNTDWIVSIPNKRSSNYTAKKNAYEQALADRAIAIANAEDSYLQAEALESDGSTQESQSGVLAARARVQSVRAQMGDGVITAPFDGVVGLLDVSEGEIVSGNTAYITLVGSSQFELSLDVPEIDVAKLEMGDEVSISLDAYGDGSTWTGMISAIDVIDTLVDGVPVYKTTVIITDADERVRVGMSAKATILAEEKFEVLRAPQYFFARGEGGYEATVMVGDEEETRKVVLGLSGSDGFVEVVSGLSSGDVLVRDKEAE